MLYDVALQVLPQLTVGMTLLAVGETAVAEMDYRERAALLLDLAACTSYRTSIFALNPLSVAQSDALCAQRLRSG